MSVLPLLSEPLASLSPIQRLKLPVSIALGEGGERIVISRFEDDVWDFWPYIPHENRAASNKKISWKVSLDDGGLLTDVGHFRLLNSAKLFLWSLYVQPIEGSIRPSMTSLIHRFFEMVPLLRWMASIGIERFRDLQSFTLAYVPVARIGSRVGVVKPSVVARRLMVLEALFRQRSKIEDALLEHPWPGESAFSLAGDRKDRKPKTDLIPESVVGPLASIAIEYVVQRSGKLLKARALMDEAAAAQKQRHKVHATIARTRCARSLGYLGQDDITNEITRLRTACYIVIDLFSGIRDSEMMSLEDCCVVPGTSRDGVNVLWLHGTLYKTGVRKKRWLVPPIVQTAIAVLSEVTQPLREALDAELIQLEAEMQGMSGQDARACAARLAKVRSSRSKLFLGLGPGQKAIQVLSGPSMCDNLRNFCQHHKILSPDGTPFSLHSHQFRRTYAHYVARSELGDLLMLREHFGHWSLDMTLLYADGASDGYEADTELMEWISQEKHERQRRILGKIASTDEFMVSTGDWLAGWRQKVRTAANKEQLVEQMSDSITLNGTGHSWCVGNAKGTGCGGLCVFEADMCVDCKFGVITAEHRPVWRGIRDQQLEVLQMDDLGVSGKARANAILIKAEKVLRKLGGGDHGSGG